MVSVWFEASTAGMVWEISYYYFGFHLHIESIWLLYFRKTNIGIVLLLVYVDDIVITGSDSQLIEQLQQRLQSSFHMKDLGPLQYFLSLEVQHCPTSVLLYQHKYTQKLLSLAGLSDTKLVLTPMEVNLKLHHEWGSLAWSLHILIAGQKFELFDYYPT